MKNIVLIGMPSCGKSTLGVVLAKTIGMSFVDTDLIIQEQENDLLQNIISTRGLEEFMKIENRVLSTVDLDNHVIATGGSAVYSEEGMKHLKSIGTVVYIKLSLEEIERRLDNITTRGVVMKEGQTLKDLFEQRVPLYEKYADLVLEADGATLERTIEKMIQLLG